jgi:hypothetical protein
MVAEQAEAFPIARLAETPKAKVQSNRRAGKKATGHGKADSSAPLSPYHSPGMENPDLPMTQFKPTPSVGEKARIIASLVPGCQNSKWNDNNLLLSCGLHLVMSWSGKEDTEKTPGLREFSATATRKSQPDTTRQRPL